MSSCDIFMAESRAANKVSGLNTERTRTAR
jgi:hypothetical protein